MKRKRVASFGEHGKKASVFAYTVSYLVEWRVTGRRKRKSFQKTADGKRDAKAFARSVAYGRKHVPAATTIGLRELWQRYTASRDFIRLRDATHDNYTTRWVKWERFMGHDHPADSATSDDLDQFHLALADRGTVPNQIGGHIGTVKMVHAWGKRRKLITTNDLEGYRFQLGKDEVRNEPDEYQWEDFERILEQLDPRDSREWRRSAVLMLIGHQGARSRAARHLRWEDVDLRAGIITWPTIFDKTGKEWTQPIRDGARSALFTARYWRERQGYTGPWVFYSSWGDKKRKGREVPGVYGAQALWKGIMDAERAAGVPKLPLRSAHGLRKMVAGQVLEETGDPVLAMQFIGDTNLKMIQKYLKRRDKRLAAAAELLDRKGPGKVFRELVRV